MRHRHHQRRSAQSLLAMLTCIAVLGNWSVPVGAAADTTPPSTPTGVTASVLVGGTPAGDVRFDGERGTLVGISSSARATVEAAAARSGSNGLRIASQGAPAYAQWGIGALPAGRAHASIRLWVRLGGRAVGQSVDLLTVANSEGRRNFDFFITGDTQRFKWDIQSDRIDQADFVVTPGRWYLIEVQVSYSGTSHTASVRIDGVDQGTITSPGSSQTVASVTVGTHSAKTHSQDYDDVAMAFSDQPVGWLDPAGGAGAATVAVVWQPATDLESGVFEYQVWRNNAWYGYVPAPLTTYFDLVPIDGARYQIRAIDRAGNRSNWSSAAQVVLPGAVDTTAPPVPMNVTLTTNPDGTRTLRWDAVVDVGSSGLREYAIYRSGRWYGFVSAPGTAFEDRTPVAGATYRVRAIDVALNRSDYSAQVG